MCSGRRHHRVDFLTGYDVLRWLDRRAYVVRSHVAGGFEVFRASACECGALAHHGGCSLSVSCATTHPCCDDA